MADEVIERLTVAIESNIDVLVNGTNDGVKQVEKRLEQMGKKAEGEFKKAEKSAESFASKTRRLFRALAGPIGVATAAIGALGIAFGVAFQAAQEGVSGIRIQRGFRALAASAGQSSEEIIAAMKRASAGTVQELELMRQANVALQLGVARTPEEFEKLTRSAIVLGRAVGRGPVEALDDLINAAGRRSTEVLDNLGISLADVNTEMERLAEQRFGQVVTQLSQAQRNALFMEAALSVADRSAQKLGASVDDIGSSIEQVNVRVQELEQDFNEASLVLIGKTTEAADGMIQAFFGPDGFFPLLSEGSNIFAEIAASAVAGFAAAAGAIAQEARAVFNVLTGQISFAEFFEEGEGIGERFALRFTENFGAARDKIKDDFAEIFDPDSVETGAASPIAPLIEETEDDTEELKELLLNSQSELLDLQQQLNEQTEELAEDHQEKMLEIEQDFAEKRRDAAEELAEDLADLEADVAEDRAQIISDAREDLTRLERETDQELEEQRDQFNTQERRETEDHLRDMRRLRQRFLFDLEDAVKARDARAVVDLRRRFQVEQQTQTEDFEIKQGRERTDQDERLRQIRENEQERANEIIQAREQELRQVAENEARKRQELQDGFQQELSDLREAEAEKRAEEVENFEERQADLDAALTDRLTLIAQKLAEEKDINQEGAEEILSTLANFFGVGGEIDNLIESFRERLDTRLKIDVDFETRRRESRERRRSSGIERGARPGRAFADGGSMIASPPGVTALFGERVPEMASFMPLNQMQNSATSTRRMEIDLRMSGSAPPGVRSTDRDAIAGVLVNALREAGLRGG